MSSEDLREIALKIVESNEDKAFQVMFGGRSKNIGWFVGQVMKDTGGIYPDFLVLEAIESVLKNYSFKNLSEYISGPIMPVV